MSVFADFTFPHRFSVDLEAWLPPAPGIVKQYYYPGANEQGGHNGILLEIQPEDGPAWMGMFADKFYTGASGVYSCPDGISLCVVALGGGHMVRADNPKNWQEIPLLPIVSVHVLLEQHLLVFCGWSSLAAYSHHGLAWETERIALNGLTIEAVEGNILRGRALVDGCTIDDDYVKWVDYEVDLLTGKHQGGLE